MIAQNKIIDYTHYQTWRKAGSSLANATCTLIGQSATANSYYAASHLPVADTHLETDTSNVYKQLRIPATAL